MKIDVIISADYIKEELIKDKVVVVIDILRATSVITTAFMNGCSELIPVLTVDEAFKIKEKDRECILGGERRAVKIDGFDLSNSPLEYSEEVVKGKRIVLSTTNGTRAITSCKDASHILIGSMLNSDATAEELLRLNEDIVLVNSGTNGQFSLDDFICSGYIISRILEKEKEIELTDISKAALSAYKEHTDILSYISEARHYGVMKSLGLLEDVKHCIQKDICNLVLYCRQIKGKYHINSKYN